LRLLSTFLLLRRLTVPLPSAEPLTGGHPFAEATHERHE
jgi:hypothetical protein